MSHEIRTPLTSILGFSNLLKNKIKDEKYLKFINIIYRNGNNLLELINDILDLSKIEAGQIQIKKEPTNIRDIFNEIIPNFSEILKQKNIELKFEIAQEIPKQAIVDRNRIIQVLLNLISNAIKFTETGYVSIVVSIEAISGLKNDERFNLIIKVIDTGIGIAEEYIGIIFDNFRQVDGETTRKYEGTGLGLAISKNLVTIMNGTISVKSKVGKGTTFIIELKNIEFV